MKAIKIPCSFGPKLKRRLKETVHIVLNMLYANAMNVRMIKIKKHGLGRRLSGVRILRFKRWRLFLLLHEVQSSSSGRSLLADLSSNCGDGVKKINAPESAAQVMAQYNDSV